MVKINGKIPQKFESAVVAEGEEQQIKAVLQKQALKRIQMDKEKQESNLNPTEIIDARNTQKQVIVEENEHLPV